MHELCASPNAAVLANEIDPPSFVRRSGESRWRPVLLLFPEKRANSPRGTTGATPAETLQEWAASRGSAAFAEWCREAGFSSLRELADASQSAEAAAAAFATSDFAAELARVMAVVRRVCR